MQFLTVLSIPYHQMFFLRFQSMADNPLIWLFIWAVIIDIVTGLAKSLVTKRTTSTKGVTGLIKHGVLILVILTLYPMLDVNGMSKLGNTFISFYILYYALSIVENWGQMGLPLPNWVKPYIYKLSDDYTKGNNKDEHDH